MALKQALQFLWEGGSRKDVGPTFTPLSGSEAWSKLFGVGENYSEEVVSERRAHGLATVYSCINVIARTAASIKPAVLQEQGPNQKQALTDHAVYESWCQEPNKYMTGANMMLTSMLHANSWGNSVIGISRDSRGNPYAFEIIQPGDWDVKVQDGLAFYSIRGEIYSASDVLHFRWLSMDGLKGISPIRQNAMLMGKAFRNERYSTMALGKKPPGILSYEGILSPTQQAQNQKSWKNDLANGDTPILSGKWTFDPILMSAEDAAYIETAKLTDQQICGIFQVPPNFIQNYENMAWPVAEQADLTFAKHTMRPIFHVVEQECNMKLFTKKEKKNTFLKYNMNALLRADSKTRAEFYTAMRNVGGMNGDDIRSLEDMNGYPGGDIFTVQSANISIDQLREFYASKIEAANAKAEGSNGSDPTSTEDNQNKNYKLNGHAHAN